MRLFQIKKNRMRETEEETERREDKRREIFWL